MASTAHEDAFLDEVLGLFVLEAQEWISQSNTALLELEHHPASDRKHKLYDTIICGITNLGGSAATVELRDLERLAYGLVPLIQAMQTLNADTATAQLRILRDGFNRIMTVVQALSETKTAEIPQLEQLLEELAEATRQGAGPSVKTSHMSPLQKPVASPSVPAMDQLVDFQRRSVGNSDQTRHTIETLIRKAKHDYGERGWRLVDASIIIQLVQDLDHADDQFLNEVRQRSPTICGIFSDLQSPHADMLLSNGRMEKLLQEVQVLHDAARACDAKPMMQFFHGLQNFLTIRSQKVVEITVERIQAVEARLKRVIALTEQWIEVGKKERAAIHHLVHS